MAWNNYSKPKIALPLKHNKDDAKWIGEVLLGIHERFRVDACVNYTKVFEETFNAEPLSQCKDGKARSQANTRLRLFALRVVDYIDKKESVFLPHQTQGKTFDISDL